MIFGDMMDISTDFKTFQARVTSALVNATRTAAQISAEDLDFQRSSNADLSTALDAQNSRILQLTNKLLKIASSDSEKKIPRIHNCDEVEDNWRKVVDVVDDLLEKADASLDEYTGVIKRLSPSRQDHSSASDLRNAASSKFPSAYDLGRSKFPKPQLAFDRIPTNDETTPFKPLLQTKPHAIVPLEQSLGATAGGEDPKEYKHPYEMEIQKSSYPPSTYINSPPRIYSSFGTTSAIFVDSPEAVLSMLAELKTAQEIAVDLEHHDLHSYIGLVSLMQISTREKDWIVDTLMPWRENLQVLNEVFADPKILKVFHGSSMDIIWLQRDLGLYVVGLFDTYHASVALGYEKRSLKFLLEKFANFKAAKKYQMADWRVRPLLPGMFNYARSDTHYLLYIYDNMRNELLEQSAPEERLIDYVLEHSKAEALQKYDRPIYDAEKGFGSGGWYDMLSRTPVALSKEQFAVFKAVHQWRDAVARSDDEGVQFTMSRQALFNVAQKMPLDKSSLRNAANPASKAVREHATELLNLIKESKASNANGPELRDVIQLRKKESRGELRSISNGQQNEEEPKDQGRSNDQSLSKSKAVRSVSSHFWGSALPHKRSTPHERSITAFAEGLLLVLPLPPLDRAVFDQGVSRGTTSLPTSTREPPEPASATTQQPDSSYGNDVFTIKELGARQKRKADQLKEEESSGEAQSLEHSNQSNQKERDKHARRDRNGGEAGVPFDYATAESILHAKPPDRNGVDGKKPFDPYAKALNAPQALRKSKKESAGKSVTFKN